MVGGMFLATTSPTPQDLDIQGFYWIRVGHNHRLISISNSAGEFHNTKIIKFLSIKLTFEMNDFECSLGNATTLELERDIEVMDIEASPASDSIGRILQQPQETTRVTLRSTVRSSQHFNMVFSRILVIH